MQGVVLHGTGRKAILEGYSAAGKTGTAQKVDPATGTYSRTKYVASFAGFAPINNPAVTVAIILDSAVGPHQGGQIAAPVFQRLTQQVLEYLHVPHDVELPPSRQVLLAERHVKDEDLAESSPDHLGGSLDGADTSPPERVPSKSVVLSAKPSPSLPGKVVSAAVRQKEAGPTSASSAESSHKPIPMRDAAAGSVPAAVPMAGTVVLDVEQGGIEVPSFVGKTVRAAIESAQDAGLELDIIGSGIARNQVPAPGSHVAAGSRIVVHFER